MKRTRFSFFLLFVYTVSIAFSCAVAQQPTFAPRADIDGNDVIDIWDIIFFQTFWMGNNAGPTPTPTGPTATPTGTPTHTSTPTPTPTLSFNGSLFGTVKDDLDNLLTLEILIDYDDPIPDKSTLAVNGTYQFVDLPIGVAGNLSITDDRFSPYYMVVSVTEQTRLDIVLSRFTPTPTQTETPTVTPTRTHTFTPTVTDTPTITNTPTLTHTPLPSDTPTETWTPTPTWTRTPTVTRTPTETRTPRPTQVPMEGTTWRGFAQVPIVNQPLELRNITSITSAEVRYTTVPYVYSNKGGALVEGVNFHFYDDNDDSPPSSNTRLTLNGVFVSGNRIEGNNAGDFEYYPNTGDVIRGTFYLERQ